MKTDTLKGDTYLLMNCDENATDIRVTPENKVRMENKVNSLIRYKPLPPGKWIKIGIGNSISEEQWKGITYGEKTFGWESFGQISGGNYQWYARAKQSGEAWIRSHGMKPETTLILKRIK